jgi:plastocyanin
MTTARRRRTRNRHRGALLGLVVLLGALAAWAPGALGAVLPDLVPFLPVEANPGQQTPVYVDAYQTPGRLLYRFDSVLLNEPGAGAFDVYRDPATQHPIQVLWPTGVPTTAPSAQPPPPSGVPTEDRGLTGANFYFQGRGGTHEHWHFASAASYQLLVPGGFPRISDKVGFCFFDSYENPAFPSYFPETTADPRQSSWCHYDEPSPSTYVRMGLSPGQGDYYWSQLDYQWVDVTGLPPGVYTLRAQVNPLGYIHESDTANNMLDQQRVIPGTTAADASARTPAGQDLDIPLSGSVVGPEVPARVSNQGACAEPQPAMPTAQCWAYGSAAGPLTFTRGRGPDHGSVRIEQRGPLVATATYHPDPGFAGTDSFTYVTSDARGLVSLPATVTIAVQGAGGTSPGGTSPGGTSPGGTSPGASAPGRRGPLVVLRTSGPVRVGRPLRVKAIFNRRVVARVSLQRKIGRRWGTLLVRTARGRGVTLVFTPRRRGRYVLRVAYRIGRRTYRSAPLVVRVHAGLAGARPASSAGTRTNPVKAKAAVRLGYDPQTLVVPPGALVYFTSVDRLPHTATAYKAIGGRPAFASGPPSAGTFTIRAPRVPGSYRYFCLVHPYQRGLLKVKR